MNDIRIAAGNYRLVRERLLEIMPELADDPDCLLDTLEGATDLTGQLAALIRSALVDEALVSGMAEYQARLAERKRILAERAQRKRSVALRYMAELAMHKITAPDFTATMQAGPPAVVVVAEELIPDEYVRIKREPDKAAIRHALKGKAVVNGCYLSNGADVLVVRT